MNYDAVICGGGHNGLVAAHYLRAAGLTVCVVEKADQPGGLCRPIEFLPGFRGTIPNSPGSFEPMIMRDMDLLSHGLKLMRSDPSLMMPFDGERAFVGWRDPERLAAEYRKFSARDAARISDFLAYIDDFAQRLGVSVFEEPPSLGEIAARLRTARDQEDFARLVLGSARDLVEDWFESEEIRAIFGFLGQVNGSGGPGVPGTAMAFLNRPLSVASVIDGASMGEDDPRRQPLRGSTGLPLGGMGSVVEAMVRSLTASGVHFRGGNGVQLIEADRDATVKAVVLDNGERITCRVVISAANPKTTLLELVDPALIDRETLDRLGRLRPRGGAFKAFLVLDDIPRFGAAPQGETEAVASCQFRIGPTLDYLDDAWADNVCGRTSRNPVLWGLTPTVSDPSMAPQGRHYVSLNVWYAPYHLKTGDWSLEKQAFGERCIDVLAEHVPNLKSALIDYRFLSPLDLEEQYGLVEAHQNHGAMSPAQMFGGRPVPGLSDYRTPVGGLYLSGAGTWPGGFVSGIPGHNSARAVLRDLRAGRRASESAGS